MERCRPCPACCYRCHRLHAAIGVTGSTWRVLDDLLGAASAKVLVNGTLSGPASAEAACLAPLLFNILFDGISAAVRAACPGVPLGRGPRAPRVTLLLYADDVVVLADSESGHVHLTPLVLGEPVGVFPLA